MDNLIQGATIIILLKYFLGTIILLGSAYGFMKTLPTLRLIVKRKDESLFDKILGVVPALVFLIGILGGGYMVAKEYLEEHKSKSEGGPAHYTLPGGGGGEESDDGD